MQATESLADEQYDRGDRAKTPLVRLNAQWIGLLLGRSADVAASCRELEQLVQDDSERLSRWARFELRILSGELTDPDEMLAEAGADQHMAAEGMVCLALLRLSEWIANPEMTDTRVEAEEMLRRATDIKGLYYPHYVAKAILHEWNVNHNPDWPITLATADGPVQETETHAQMRNQ